MKNTLLKFYITSFCLLTNFIMFAAPGDDSDSGNLEGNDAPAAPINGKLILLAIAGTVYAFYTFRKYRKHQTV
ncbi:hypothetical protein [Flavobacterium sp. DSP2-3-1]|uniref:hypothetical protein n=1 Tax=Flavobacterium sp. DSP2-3-1 TaxID=2804620 RepID=UPI003CEE051C